MTEESKVQIASSAIVCAEAQINGEVTIGEGCVVHPYVTFDAKNGPIIIGDNNLFEEYSIIQNNSDGQPMIIGDSNHFQVKSECRAKYVGSRNVIGILAQLGDGCFVADDCYVAVGRRIEPKHTLENFVSVAEVGDIHRKVEVPNMPTTVQLEFLRKLLPSYHHLHGRKPKTAAVTKK